MNTLENLIQIELQVRNFKTEEIDIFWKIILNATQQKLSYAEMKNKLLESSELTKYRKKSLKENFLLESIFSGIHEYETENDEMKKLFHKYSLDFAGL